MNNSDVMLAEGCFDPHTWTVCDLLTYRSMHSELTGSAPDCVTKPGQARMESVDRFMAHECPRGPRVQLIPEFYA